MLWAQVASSLQTQHAHEHTHEHTHVPLPERFDSLFDDAVPLLGVQFIMAILLGGLLIIHLARYARMRDRLTVGAFQQGRRAPRLIVSGGLQVVAAHCALIGIALVLYLGWHEVIGISQRRKPIG